MSEANSLYRRHRPHSFDQVVGQEHVVRTLSNAITEGQIHHAYLFVGSRGTGKTSMAKILAASLNCENGGPTLTPCGECESCRTIAAGSSVDVIEMDAASNRSVEDIRELRERVAFAPAAGHWKVYILDEAHMLTKEAWNAFLKTLEEPPPNTLFILATTEAHKVMPTIADRCQRFDFHRPSVAELSEVVNRVATAEGIGIDPGTVSMIARAANGSFRDALGTLDQLVSFSGSDVALEDVLELLGAADADLLFGTVDAVVESDPKAVLEAVDTAVRGGRDPARFARDLLGHLRVLLLVRMTGEIPETFTPTVSDPARLTTQSQAIGPSHLVLTIDELAAALGQVRQGDESRIALEVALLKAARPDLDPSVEGLVRRMERLEQDGAPPKADLPDPPAPAAGSASPPSETEATPEPEAAPTPTSPAPAGDLAPVESAAPADPGTPDPQPTAVESAGPAGSASKGVLADVHHLVQVWPAVIDAIRAADSGPAASYFEGTRPLETDGSKVVVGFPPDAGFNRRNAEKPERREQLAEAILSVTGERPELEYTELETDHETDGEAVAVKEAIDEEELVEKVKAEFNAEEVI